MFHMEHRNARIAKAVPQVILDEMRSQNMEVHHLARQSGMTARKLRCRLLGLRPVTILELSNLAETLGLTIPDVIDRAAESIDKPRE